MKTYSIEDRLENAGHILGAIKFWSLYEVAGMLKVEGDLFDKVLFSAKLSCAVRDINYEEHFCSLPTDTLVTDFGLCRFLKSIPIAPDILPDTQHDVILAKDYFEIYEPNNNKFISTNPNANNFFLMPGDKVRILKEIGQSRGLYGATGVVQFHTFDTLSIIGPSQFFCNREDVELIERKGR